MRTIIAASVTLLLALPAWGQEPAGSHDAGTRAVARTSESAADPFDPTEHASGTSGATLDDDGRGTDYIVDKTDNICGIDEPRAISNPAKVDYDAVLEATKEVKLLRRRRIDPESAKGIKLMTEARRKVLAACEAIRADGGYCSIWKAIRRRDHTPIDDVTARVKAKLAEDEPE